MTTAYRAPTPPCSKSAVQQRAFLLPCSLTDSSEALCVFWARLRWSYGCGSYEVVVCGHVLSRSAEICKEGNGQRYTKISEHDRIFQDLRRYIRNTSNLICTTRTTSCHHTSKRVHQKCHHPSHVPALYQVLVSYTPHILLHHHLPHCHTASPVFEGLRAKSLFRAFHD